MNKYHFLRLCWGGWILLGGGHPEVAGWELCESEHNNDSSDASEHFCPDGNTCCIISEDDNVESKISYGCIPSRSHDPANATRPCCNSFATTAAKPTGCAYRYHCGTQARGTQGTQEQPVCLLNDESNNNDEPPMPKVTNRYRLCSIPNNEMLQLQSFPMEHATTTKATTKRDNSKYLAYYSNMGNIRHPTNEHLQLTRALIIVHGSARNADDYFCTGLSLLSEDEPEYSSTARSSANTLILAPWFKAPSDEPPFNSITNTSDEEMLVWAAKEDAEHPLAHSWRYGADALNAHNVSSFDALDRLVEYLVKASLLQYPQLQSIVVAGHSAGGQIVHRWALLSNSFAWDGYDQPGRKKIHTRAVVANPRSYAYLDDRRILPAKILAPIRHQEDHTQSHEFRLPDAGEMQDCPSYNQWPWGLEAGDGYLEVPYKKHALEVTPAPQMSRRYTMARDVVYLSGQYDVEDLQDRCETVDFQGPNRHVRAKHFFRGLQEFFRVDNARDDVDTGAKIHQLHFVPGSPHDHMLMFQSPQGLEAIFHTPSLNKLPLAD